jgi:hypothetical protein
MQVWSKQAWCAAGFALIVFSGGCSAPPPAPSSVGAGDPVAGEAAADGSTLKVTAPVPVSPHGDVRLDGRRPTMTAMNSTGRYASVSFTYEFQLLDDHGRLIRTASVAGDAQQTVWAYPEDLDRDTAYRWQVRATYQGAFGPWSPQARFLTVAEKRTPNPPPGGKLPRPDWAASIVFAAYAARPDLVARSCQTGGGTWEFLDYLVDQLRLADTRFGYNCKRGNCNDPSHDIVAYNWSADPDPGTANVYIIDIMIGHCVASAPGWIDQTQLTLDSGTIGRWTSRGRF